CPVRLCLRAPGALFRLSAGRWPSVLLATGSRTRKPRARPVRCQSTDAKPALVRAPKCDLRVWTARVGEDSAFVDGVSPVAVLREPQRRRLVRLCAVVSGDYEAAEDLAQETLLEAWRNAHKLHDPAGADPWLAAIARNVCRRWARRRGRERSVAALEAA